MMAAEPGAEAGLAHLGLSADENRIFRQLFRQADTDNVGVVTGEVAVPFFERTRLDSRALGEIWRIADKENRGFLTFAGFAIVLRLIGHAQANRQPSDELAMQPGQLPRFDGFSPTPAPLTASHTGGGGGGGGGPGLVPQATGPSRFPLLTPDRVAQYTTLFERQQLQNGMLPGEQARQLFVKSNLPGDVLRKIWELADTEQRGSLALTEFVIAMHLLSSMKTGALRALPNVLPAALYEAATRRGSIASASAPRQSPTHTGPPMPAIPRQLTGSGMQPRAGSPLGRPPMGPPQQQQQIQPNMTGHQQQIQPNMTGHQQQIQPNMTGHQQQIQSNMTGHHQLMQPSFTGQGDWLITPPDKARFDQVYDNIDKNGKGFIAGDEAVDFMRQSNLPEGTLAVIWDLSDINADGALNRDEFAVAMYLIRQQRSGPPGSVAMPTALPPNLIPPSMRAPAQRPQTATSVFDAPTQVAAPPPPLPPIQPPPQPKSAMDDLFGLSATSPTSPHPPAQMQVPLSTGGSAAQDPFAGGGPVFRGGSPPRQTPTSSFRPFMPTSSFGRGLTSQTTGSDMGAAISEDLLGDTDPEVSKKLTSETTELANLSNQVGSLSKQMQEVQGQRATTQNDLSQANMQKKNFEARLAQLRTMYEKEAADAQALREQLANSRKETQKLQTECLSLEGKYKDAQQEHQQLLAALQADQQENAALRERIRVVSGEITQLKAQVERFKSEARQQKGLVAINKKQVSTGEAERDRLRGEVDELSKNDDDVNRTASPAQSVRDQVASPAASVSSANNPFFRRTGSADVAGTFASPPPPLPSAMGGDRTLDDVFGPAFARSTATPPPPAPFAQQQHTGASSAASMSSAAFATPPVSNSVPVATPPVSNTAPVAAEADAAPPTAPPFFTSPFGDMADRAKNNGTPGAASERLATPVGASRAPSPAAARSADATPGPTVADMWAPIRSDTKSPPPTSSGEAEGFDSAKAKADFDNAFASFTKSKKSQDSLNGGGGGGSGGGGGAEANKSIATFNTEFPPISELERDVDDEESSDDEGGGFDDDFAPVSPPAKGAAQPPRPMTPIATQSTDPFASTPKNATTQSTTADDDEFDGLEDAKEGSPDDDFANISRSGFDEFNPVFDSPGHSQKAGGNMFGDGGFEFTPAPAQGQGVAAPAPAAGKEKESHDWDAIFADLDATPESSAPPPAATTVTATAAEPEADDPMVKNLTSMGYTRSDVVAALEKHDYNLDQAANFLASQS